MACAAVAAAMPGRGASAIGPGAILEPGAIVEPGAVIGPEARIGRGTTIAAGTLENNEANLEKWIHNSADIKPGSKMPPMGSSGAAGGSLSDDEIKAVAAYLLELK